MHTLIYILFISTAFQHFPLTAASVDSQAIYNTSKSESPEFLFPHNLVRSAHGQLPLAWDSDLEAYARGWAAQRQHDCRLQHSSPEGGLKFGENLFFGGGSSWTPGDAVRLWAGEEKYYSYSDNSCEAGQVCGHYTQIVWGSTRRLGCARVVCDGGDVFMNCNYDPPGNIVGERPY